MNRAMVNTPDVLALYNERLLYAQQVTAGFDLNSWQQKRLLDVASDLLVEIEVLFDKIEDLKIKKETTDEQ